MTEQTPQTSLARCLCNPRGRPSPRSRAQRSQNGQHRGPGVQAAPRPWGTGCTAAITCHFVCPHGSPPGPGHRPSTVSWRPHLLGAWGEERQAMAPLRTRVFLKRGGGWGSWGGTPPPSEDAELLEAPKKFFDWPKTRRKNCPNTWGGGVRGGRGWMVSDPPPPSGDAELLSKTLPRTPRVVQRGGGVRRTAHFNRPLKRGRPPDRSTGTPPSSGLWRALRAPWRPEGP